MKANTKEVIAVNDKRILLMLNQRNEDALNETVKRYGALYKSVVRDILGNDQDAEECLNDALLQVWNTIPPIQPDNYCAYLIRIVRNIALNRYKARRTGKRGSGQQTEALDELSELISASDTVQSVLEKRELLAAITHFLQGLPQKQRDLFVRRYWRFASYKDLALDFGMQENSVQVTLSRIRKKLQSYLKEEGFL
jgi:RNA polymerase sigma-70 factor (ECF subfamily)